MYDVIIIGAGPAGISAAIYTRRANLKVMVLYHGRSELEKAEKIENFYGFPGGISGEDLYKRGIKQAKELGVELREKEVIDIALDKNLYKVVTSNEEYKGKTIIIATGNKKINPNSKGINQFVGKGISYCAICDGFFYRNKEVAVIGNGDYAISEAEKLENIVKNIKILTNGLNIVQNSKVKEKNYKIDTRKIKEIRGKEKVEYIEFEDGERLNLDGIFIAIGEAGGVDFAKKLGITMQGENIKTDEEMQTNVKGIFACGNLTGGLFQVNKAVYEGAKAGLKVIEYIKKN